MDVVSFCSVGLNPVSISDDSVLIVEITDLQNVGDFKSCSCVLVGGANKMAHLLAWYSAYNCFNSR